MRDFSNTYIKLGNEKLEDLYLNAIGKSEEKGLIDKCKTGYDAECIGYSYTGEYLLLTWDTNPVSYIEDGATEITLEDFKKESKMISYDELQAQITEAKREEEYNLQKLKSYFERVLSDNLERCTELPFNFNIVPQADFSTDMQGDIIVGILKGAGYLSYLVETDNTGYIRVTISQNN